MEVLLNGIRNSNVGIDIENDKSWGCAIADDLTLFLKNEHELNKTLDIIEDYRSNSGLEINHDKSEILNLNYSCESQRGIPVVRQVEITGIWHSMDKLSMEKLNLGHSNFFSYFQDQQMARKKSF